jgi:hypothetical protein
LRLEFEDAIYHLLGRGNARQRVFAGERDQQEFLKLLEASTKRFDVLVHAFAYARPKSFLARNAANFGGSDHPPEK